MKRIVMATILAATVAVSALAGGTPSTEVLVLPPFPGGKSVWKKVQGIDTAQQLSFIWIPADQTKDNVTNLLVEEAFYTAKNMAPAQFAAGMIRTTQRACHAVAASGPITHMENGYPIAYAQIYCLHQNGKNIDVDIFLKAIQGRKALYVVQREFHRPTGLSQVPGVKVFPKGHEAEAKAYMEAQAAAAKYLDDVQLCPPATGTGKCPVESAPQPGK